ncbi:stage III sporulation protein SpoIIIAB [Paenibacillus tarimensis]
MIKIIGAMLVLFAGGMIGFQQAARFAARPRQLRQLGFAVSQLETEIGYGYTPLPDALIRAVKTLSEPVAGLFIRAAALLEDAKGLSFNECWEQAVKEHWQHTAMRENEKAVLLRLGSSLGISDREDQLKHLRLALLQLKSEEDAARDDQARYEKLSKSLGILAAALIVILML